MKPNKKNIKYIYGSTIIISVLLILLVSIFNSYYEKNIEESDLIKFDGEIIYYQEKQVGGSRKNSVILYKLDNKDLTFKISNNSYNSVNLSDLRHYFKIGNSIEVGTIKNEIKKAENSSLLNKTLNKIIDTRINPQTYFIKYQDRLLFDLKKYNESERNRKEGNLIFGSLLCVIGIGFFGFVIYINWKTRFEKN